MKKVIIIPLILIFLMSACQHIQQQIDLSGLESLADNINETFQTNDPEELEKFIDNFNLEKASAPLSNPDFHYGTIPNWSLRDEFPDIAPEGNTEEETKEKSGGITERSIWFTGPLNNEHRNVNRAVFYHYKTPASTNQVILFVPGLGVSDFAFWFIQDFFIPILKEGYQLLVYIPPYHMERSINLNNNYYRLFTSDNRQNILNINAMLTEIRTMVKEMERQGIKKFSAWSGSIGASVMLIGEQFLPLEHLTVVIPVVDYNELLKQEVMRTKVTKRLNKAGIDKDLLDKTYSLISPVSYPLSINPEKVFILAAYYDQLNGAEVVANYAKAHGITQTNFYERSHSTILLEDGMYEDYTRFLKANKTF